MLRCHLTEVASFPALEPERRQHNFVTQTYIKQNPDWSSHLPLCHFLLWKCTNKSECSENEEAEKMYKNKDNQIKSENTGTCAARHWLEFNLLFLKWATQ